MFIFWPNFIIILTRSSSLIETWRSDLFVYKFWHYVNNLKTKPWIDFRTRIPRYATFKKSTFNKIGSWFRLLVAIVPTIILIRLIIDFQNTPTWWIFATISAPFIVPAIVLFITDIVLKIRVQAHNASIKLGKNIICRYGSPGAGKTSSLLYDMKILADIMWDKICREYKLLKPYLKDIPYWPQKIKEDALEIIEAYNFYIDSNTYPCLWTSVPSFIDGLPANRITADHLMQREKLPYGAIIVLDEVSLILPPELFRNTPTELKELAKFPRHIGDFHIGTTEQGKNGMLIDFRNSAAEKICMVEQQWILRPVVLTWIYNKLLDSKKKLSKMSVTFFRAFNSIINSIGYRKFTYYDGGTEDRPTTGLLKTFILPPYLNISYDSRAFKNIYRCKDKPLNVSSWEHMRLSKEEIEAIFTKELQERGQTKKQRKKGEIDENDF